MIKRIIQQQLIFRHTFIRFCLPFATSLITLTLVLLAASALAACNSNSTIKLTPTPTSPPTSTPTTTATPTPTLTAVPGSTATVVATSTVEATSEATTTSHIFFPQPANNALVALLSPASLNAAKLTIEPTREVEASAWSLLYSDSAGYVMVSEKKTMMTRLALTRF